VSAPSASGQASTPGLSNPAPAAAPALDYRAGLERLMGDQAMYLRVLTRFHIDYRDSGARLHGALAGGDLVLAQRIVHTLKGAAAMIEARLLRQFAADAEQALRAGAGCEPRLVEGLERELARVMAQLEMLLQRPRETEHAPARESADAPVSGADLARLCAMLDLGDSAAQDFIGKHGAGLAALLGQARMGQLQAAMDAFDFEGALRVLRPGAGQAPRPASLSG
jgi:HPt (histidine-containing phosphotransfer) domain-containing protein